MLLQKQHKAPAFLAMNPLGQVPVLRHRGLTLVMSNVVLDYLARTTGHFEPKTEQHRWQAREWLSWENDAITNVARVRHFARFRPDVSQDIVSFFRPQAEAALDWTVPAELLARRVRAFNPFPGAATELAGEAIKVWTAHAEDAAGGAPGEVLAVGVDGVRVATGAGVLVLTELQRAGGKRLPVADFLRGFPLQPGQVLEPSFKARA